MILSRVAPVVALFGLAMGQPLVAEEAKSGTAAELARDVGEQRPPLIPTEDLAGRSHFWDAKLSPDGRYLSFVRRYQENESAIAVVEIGTNRIVTLTVIPKDSGLLWYKWAGSDRLLISVATIGDYFGARVPYTRLMLAFLEENTSEILHPKNDPIEGDNVIYLADDGSYALVTYQKNDFEFPSVYRHELTHNGSVTQIQKPIYGVWNWYADDAGVVRMGTGWRSKKLRIHYRPDENSEFKLIAKIKEGETDRFWDVAQIIEGTDKGYVLDEGENGRVGLRLFDYATRQVVETVYEHPEWDIDEVSLKDGKPFAAFYTDDRDRVIWFDKDYDKLYRQLRAALKQDEIWVTSLSRNKERMLVWAGNEADPGVLYMFTPSTSRLEELAQYRPKLDYKLLARPKPVSYTARDGTKIAAYLTLPRGRDPKSLPLIILPHGGPYGVRDKLNYDDEVQLLANRGYAVLQPNYRGSGGYGDAFFELGTGQIGRGMQDDLDDAMDWAVAEGIADPARVCVVGASYGGYAALWSVIRNPERYRCAASWAGVTDWDLMLKYDQRFFTRAGGKKWRARIEGEEEFDLDVVSPYRQAEKLSRPVLLAHGTADTNVPFTQYKKFEKAVQAVRGQVTTLVIEGEGHGFSKPESEKSWYDALEAFLAKHNPAD